MEPTCANGTEYLAFLEQSNRELVKALSQVNEAAAFYRFWAWLGMGASVLLVTTFWVFLLRWGLP